MCSVFQMNGWYNFNFMPLFPPITETEYDNNENESHFPTNMFNFTNSHSMNTINQCNHPKSCKSYPFCFRFAKTNKQYMCVCVFAYEF